MRKAAVLMGMNLHRSKRTPLRLPVPRAGQVLGVSLA